MKKSTARKLLLGASSFFRSRFAPLSPQSPSCWELSRYQSQSCANGACVRTPKSDGRLSKNLTSNQKNSSYLQHTCLFHVSMASFREIQYLLTGLFPIVWKEVGRRWKHDELCRTCQNCTLSKSKISPTLSEWRRKAIYPSPHIGTQLSSLPWLCGRSEVLRRKLAAIAIFRLARPQPRPCSTQMSRFSHIFPTVRIDCMCLFFFPKWAKSMRADNEKHRKNTPRP